MAEQGNAAARAGAGGGGGVAGGGGSAVGDGAEASELVELAMIRWVPVRVRMSTRSVDQHQRRQTDGGGLSSSAAQRQNLLRFMGGGVEAGAHAAERVEPAHAPVRPSAPRQQQHGRAAQVPRRRGGQTKKLAFERQAAAARKSTRSVGGGGEAGRFAERQAERGAALPQASVPRARARASRGIGIVDIRGCGECH